MTEVIQPAVMVFCGPVERRSDCARALISVGLAPLPDHIQAEVHSWGLPSYTDPITAHEAGKPNAGHHVDQGHPAFIDYLVQAGDHEEGCTVDTDGEPVECIHVGHTEPRPHMCEYLGQPYEEDKSIGWLSVYGDAVNSAAAAATSAGWSLRLHSSPSVMKLPEPGDVRFQPPSDDELFAKLEARYESLRPRS